MKTNLVRKFPIDWAAIAIESGCTKGKLCKTAFGWGILNGNGQADVCLITAPETGPNETLRIEGREWCVYSNKTV